MDILAAIEHHNYTITPSQVSSLCSIPIPEAESELCGISARVPGSTFTMVPNPSSPDAADPTFTFPPTFRSTLSTSNLQEDALLILKPVLHSFLSTLRVLFGLYLLLSLLVIVIALLILAVAALRSNIRLPRTFQSNLQTLHNLTVFYYIFGGSNPFFSSVGTWSYATMAVFNPRMLLNPFFVLRMRRMGNMRRYGVRRFGDDGDYDGDSLYSSPSYSSSSDVEDNIRSTIIPTFISSVDEFLFGPKCGSAVPSKDGRDRIRIRVIQERGLKVSEEFMKAWSDDPTKPLSSIHYLRGVPVVPPFSSDNTVKRESYYHFPHLSDVRVSNVEDVEAKRVGFWYVPDDVSSYTQVPVTDVASPTKYLNEGLNVVTRLPKTWFLAVLTVGALNFVGIYYLNSMYVNEYYTNSPLDASGEVFFKPNIILRLGMGSLKLYAWGFFAVFGVRAGVMWGWNFGVKERNKKRREIANGLEE